MNSIKPIHLLWLIIIPITFIKCGQRGTLTGGPKDSIPPILINASPKMNTVHFDRDEIRLTFDEFITLKDINNQLVISPPLEIGAYTLSPRTGATKRISIKLVDTLYPNTTYTFNFGKGIADNNEGNILSNFAYVLSTGETIDSLTLSGLVADAIALKPPSDISVQLYRIDSTYTDSIIYLEKPLYVANTLDSTYYKFQNLSQGKYQLIALKDQNANFLFDQNQDKIGFHTQFVELPKDSVVNLKIFEEIIDFSWALPEFYNHHLILQGYYGQWSDQMMEMISDVPNTFESIITQPNETDSLYYWFKGAELDSLKFQFFQKDSLITRTLRFTNPAEDSLVINQLTVSTIHLNKTFDLYANRPIVAIDTTLIRIFDIDTALVPYQAMIDPNKHKVSFNFEVTPNDQYQIHLHPGALVDYFEATHDTLELSIKSIGLEEYGTITVNVIADSELHYILQLVDNQGELVRSVVKNPEDESYVFQYLLPGTYFVRLVKDQNNNEIWDTGNFLKKIQPEQVIYHPDTLELRANWEFNEQFHVSQTDLDLLETPTDSLVN